VGPAPRARGQQQVVLATVDYSIERAWGLGRGFAHLPMGKNELPSRLLSGLLFALWL
jgi:hypothetical protein